LSANRRVTLNRWLLKAVNKKMKRQGRKRQGIIEVIVKKVKPRASSSILLAYIQVHAGFKAQLKV
jgi:hypothetical protein